MIIACLGRNLQIRSGSRRRFSSVHEKRPIFRSSC